VDAKSRGDTKSAVVPVNSQRYFRFGFDMAKQKKIWVPAYDYDADGNIVVFGDAIVDAANASRFVGTADDFEFIGTEDEVEVES